MKKVGGVQGGFFFYKILTFYSKYRLLTAFSLVLIGIISLDILFHDYVFQNLIRNLQTLLQGPLILPDQMDLSFAPEVWLSVVGISLGTLIIVISIAAQSIPKIVDVYMQDWISLFYIWFLVLAGIHAVFIKLYNEIIFLRPASVILNIYIFLPIAIVLTLPYIFYILQCTQPKNVIRRIFRNHLNQIHDLTHRRIYRLLNIDVFIEETQDNLFQSFNQLDNLLEYVPLKEAKAQIIQDMSSLVQEYITLKTSINPNFFKVSTRVRADISFKTMIGQFKEMEHTRTFYEQKCFRVLGNTYVQFLEQNEFDLASLCGSEMDRVGQMALKMGDDRLLDVIIMRFNTMMRFALKHGVKNNEARNLYNAAFHYRNFIENLVRYKKVEHSKRSFAYLRLYGTEIFKYGRTSPSMYFIVDVFAAEMKRILILVYQENWSLEIQSEMLNEMLQIDSYPDFKEIDSDREQLVNTGVRVLQIGLGLFYLRHNNIDFVERIIQDILADLDFLGEVTFRRGVELTCNRLRLSNPNFWEDTDRGSLNLYYTPDQDQIDRFLELFHEQMKRHLSH
ncbi:hypothetical protein BST81_08815 [Leptolyngbya sp. 'hensonii']|nr:hypothetical protein BST81_08815 [Leptolyngbya sp. 'hensonii']